MENIRNKVVASVIDSVSRVVWGSVNTYVEKSINSSVWGFIRVPIIYTVNKIKI